jgi:hypothetical protein
MIFKLKKFNKILDAFKSGLPDDAEVEFLIKEEDLQSNKLGSCMVITAIWIEQPSKYDNETSEIDVVRVLEMFPESEGIPARCTTTKSRNIGS